MPRSIKSRVAFSQGDAVGSRHLTSDYFIADSGRISYRFVCTVCGTEGQISQGLLKQSISCCDSIRSRGRDMLRVVWDDMHNRCQDVKHPQYHRYGGRGIGVEGWSSYLDFKAWSINQGYSYQKKHDLDRIDNDLGYNPSNCRFVSRSVNSRNRSSARNITAFGITRSLSEWADRAGIQAQTIAARIDRYGWSPERAVSSGLSR